jgi:excisionase family DNA binding protein
MIEPTDQKPTPLAYSITDAAAMLGIGRSKFYKLLDEGHLPTINIGRRRLIAHADLVAFMDMLRGIGTTL